MSVQANLKGLYEKLAAERPLTMMEPQVFYCPKAGYFLRYFIAGGQEIIKWVTPSPLSLYDSSEFQERLDRCPIYQEAKEVHGPAAFDWYFTRLEEAITQEGREALREDLREARAQKGLPAANEN